MANADTSELDERDLLRIMISTDNHLGVNEDDAVRGDDSFRAFEEVLRKAVENRCDLVLLGGDLFHDNQPSRSTMHKTVRILKKYCMSDRPVSFQILSNQAENFPSTGVVNYEDPNYNVGLPIFTIHGNHDDPTGVGRLSAVDILAQCALVNYFGNVELEGSGIGKLKISPVLLQKGATHLALYGLGNIREERLGRLFKTPGNVEWERPEEAAADWFSMFVLHQNREKRGPKNFLDEAVLPEFLDLVLWGHEHQCIPTPQDAMAKNEDGEAAFEILQAGSTVPTSLSEGEADPKHCFILEMMGAQYRVLQTPLETVRPFMYGQVCLRTAANLDPDDVKGTESFLEEQVSKMIHQATSSSGSNMLPLIRLKVDYTGFSTINVQRFGQRFVKKVANPQDILIFSKQAQRRQQQEQEQREDDMERLRPEQLDQARIEDLIAEHIGPGEPLEVLLEEELKVALHHFVDKDERQALEACVKGVLQRLQADMEAGTQGAEGIKAGAMEEMIRSRASEISSQARAGADSAGDRAGAPVAASSPAPVLQRPSATLPSPSPAATSEQQARVDAFFKPMPRARSSGRAASSIGSAQPDRAKGAHSRRGAGGAAADDEDPVKLTQTSRARPAREAAKRGGAARRRQVVSDEDDSDEIAGSDGSGDDSDGIVDDDGDGDSWMRDSEEDAPPSSHRSRRRNGKAKAKAAVTPSSRNKRTRSDAWGGAVDAENPQGSAKRPGTAGIWPPRARSKQTPGTMATPSARTEVDEDVVLVDSDDEEEELGGPKVSRRLPASISQRMPTPSKRAGWGSMT